MFGRFDAEKATEAAAVLLKTARKHRMNYMRLLKLLYLADRVNIEQSGQPFIGDEVYAMKNGPVLSAVLDAIENDGPAAATWHSAIRRIDGTYEVELTHDPGVGHLSDQQVGILLNVAETHRHRNEWALSRFTHQLEEWDRNDPDRFNAKRVRIEPQHILEALGMGEDAEEILAEAQYHAHMSRQFAWAERETAGAR